MNNRKNVVFLVLTGFFITNAILAELTGGKLIDLGPFDFSIFGSHFSFGPFVATAGVVPWPVVFLTTDLINEYFGKEGVRNLTWLTMVLISFAYAVLFLLMQIPGSKIVPGVPDEAFSAVFGQSLWIIVGSLVAFAVAQLVDVSVFWLLRHKTGAKHLWLRSTGSTLVSQLIDTFVVMGVAFWLPYLIEQKIGRKVSVVTMNTSSYISVSLTNYTYKFVIALMITPIIYLVHGAVEKYLAGDGNAPKANAH